MADQKKPIGYRPDDPIEEWIKDHAVGGRDKTDVVDIAVKFLMAWPEDDVDRILGGATPQKLKAFISSVRGENEADELKKTGRAKG